MVEDKTANAEEQPLKEHCEHKVKSEPQTWKEKLCYIKSNISVEPIMAGLVIPSMLSRLAVQNMNLEKTCRIKLHLGPDVCSALMKREGNYTQHEGDVQQIVASIEAWRNVIQTAIPTVLVLLMGAWSDHTGNRKACILMPIIGEILVCLSNFISVLFFDSIPVEVTMFLEALFPAITGGWVMVYLGVFSYISDITPVETRTFRVGLVNLCLTAGIPIGTALSGISLKWVGYYGIFAISGTIYLITLTYGLYNLKSNTKHIVDDDQKEPFKVLDIVSLVKETASVVTKKREGDNRIKIILTLLVVAIIYGPNHGERIVFYMFLRYRLNWDALKYSFYSTYSIITHSLGALFSISVFSKRWGFHDSALCLISVASKLVGSACIVFVQKDWHMLMVPLVEILNATTFTSLRSMASKLVPNEEMGKMNSLFSLVETLAAMMFDPAYSAIYSKTIKVFTGAVFVFSGATAIPSIAILVWIFWKHRQDSKQRRVEDAEKETEMNNLEKEDLKITNFIKDNELTNDTLQT